MMDNDIPDKYSNINEGATDQQMAGQQIAAVVDKPVSIADHSRLGVNLKMLLVEDASLTELPVHVANTIESIDSTGKTASDMLIALLFCLALESGFVVHNMSDQNYSDYNLYWGSAYNRRITETFASLPKGFRLLEGASYKIIMQLTDFAINKCYLIAIRSGDSLCVTFTSEGLLGRSIMLPISRYVPIANTNRTASYFRNLIELSLKTKQQLFMPIRNDLMQMNGHLYCALDGLPTAVLLLILAFLKLSDLQKLSQTCLKMRQDCLEHFNFIQKKRKAHRK